MEMKLEQVEKYGYRCVTFRGDEVKKEADCLLDLLGRSFIIQDVQAFQCQVFYESKQNRYRLIGPGYSLKWIFPVIRLLYDQNGILIARRSGPGQALRFTGKGVTKRLTFTNSKVERRVC